MHQHLPSSVSQHRTIQTEHLNLDTSVFQYLDSNQVSPIKLGSRATALRYHDVFFMTHGLDLEPNQPQLLLSVTVQHTSSWKVWNLLNTTVDSEGTVTTVHKEY